MEALVEVEGTFEIDVMRCNCGKPHSHAPYRDGSRLNFLRRLRARLLRRPLINVPCPTPVVERQVTTRIFKLTPAELLAVTGGQLGDTSS